MGISIKYKMASKQIKVAHIGYTKLGGAGIATKRGSVINSVSLLIYPTNYTKPKASFNLSLK